METRRVVVLTEHGQALSIRIPGDLLALIDQQAKTESRTRSNMIVTALKKYFTT